MDRQYKTSKLVSRWLYEDGIGSSMENVYQSIRNLITSIYDKLPHNKLDELYEEITSGEDDDEVSNNNDTNNNENI